MYSCVQSRLTSRTAARAVSGTVQLYSTVGGARSVCVTLHARAQGSHLEVLFILRLIRVRVRVPLLSSLFSPCFLSCLALSLSLFVLAKRVRVACAFVQHVLADERCASGELVTAVHALDAWGGWVLAQDRDAAPLEPRARGRGHSCAQRACMVLEDVEGCSSPRRAWCEKNRFVLLFGSMMRLYCCRFVLDSVALYGMNS